MPASRRAVPVLAGRLLAGAGVVLAFTPWGTDLLDRAQAAVGGPTTAALAGVALIAALVLALGLPIAVARARPVATVVLLLVLAPLVGSLPLLFRGDVGARWQRLNGVVLDRMVDSTVLALGVTVIGTAFGLALAFCLHRRRFFGRRVVGLLYVVPLLVPPHIHAISWMRIFGRQGFFTRWLADEHGVAFDVRQGYLELGGSPTFYPGSTWMMACAFWPLAALVISSGFRQIDTRREEAALMARGPRATFLGVTLPELDAHVLTGAFFVFLFAISCYPVPQLLDTPCIMIEIFFTASQVDSAAAAVVALPLIVVTLLALGFVVLRAGRRVFAAGEPRPTPEALRRPSVAAGIFSWGLLIVTAGVPFSALLWQAGGLDTYRAVFGNVREDLFASLEIALLAAAVLAVAGTAVAFACHRAGPRRGLLVEAAALLPLAIPAVVVAVAINVFWGGFAGVDLIERVVYRGLGAPLLAYLMLFLPFTVRAVRTALARVPRSTVEAAALAGRSEGAIARRVLLPMAGAGIAAGAVLGFVLTLGELVAGLMVNPDAWQTAQARIFNMIHFSRDEEVAALCVMVAALALLPMALYALVADRKIEVL